MALCFRWLLLLALSVAVDKLTASHFRGAIISWKPGQNKNDIIVDYRISWRMTYSNSFYCTDNTIQTGLQIGGEGNLECFSNCASSWSNSMGYLYYTCTDYSNSEDWSSGIGRILHTFPSAFPPVYEFGFRGSAWIDTLNSGGGGAWYLWTKADLSFRRDIGKINSSPTANISPIVRLQYGCNHTIAIPVNDPDGDVVKCQWSYYRAQKCGSVCSGFPNSYLDHDTCTITYEAKYNTGWYAAAIQVEDYLNVNSSTYMSSIPVQFLIYVYPSSQSCAKTTEFIDPTPHDSACIGVPVGKSFSAAIVARVADVNRSVSEIKTLSPVGLTHTALYNVSETDWRVNFTYKPPNNNDVTNSFCFSAKETSGSESDKRCITLLNGVSAPAFVNGTQSPNGRVYPTQRQWNITIDSEFSLVARHSYIRLFNDTNHLMESIDASDRSKVTSVNQILNFVSTSNLKEKDNYYFLFDFGVVKGRTFCGAESFAVEDSTFWRFRIHNNVLPSTGDVTPPVISWLQNRGKTNSTTLIEWSVNEPVNNTCTLTQPYGIISTFPCDNSWMGTNLEEGQYSFRVDSDDFEDNRAGKEHTWIVDTTPPALTVTEQPANISNARVARFQWNCLPQPCSTKCVINGLRNSYVANCQGTSLSWPLPIAASNVTYTLILEGIDDVGNTIDVSYNWTTDFDAPKVSFCPGGRDLMVDCKLDLHPESICNVTVKDNMDQKPSLTYSDTRKNCSILRSWTTTDSAGNKETSFQNIKLVSNQSMLIRHVPGPMAIACGALDEITPIIESLFNISHPCGLSLQFTYADDIQPNGCDLWINRTWNISDGCGRIARANQLLRIQQAKKPLSPLDGETGVNLNTYLQWQGSRSVVKYDVYVWLSGNLRPSAATAVTYSYYVKLTSLIPATRYSWQVVYNYPDSEAYYSPIWVFETQKFSDIVVHQIDVPDYAFTGELCEVRWTITNLGSVTTPRNYWIDAVYLSWDDTFRNSKLVARVNHFGVLFINDSYTATASFTLDEKQFGKAFVAVYIDYTNHLEEYNRTNNWLEHLTKPVNVRLTPPPDLQVVEIRPSANRVFSGSTATVTWKVVNAGDGPTKHAEWYDRVWWSPSRLLGSEAQVVSTVRHFGILKKNMSYTETCEIAIPEFIMGDFFITTQVDVYNQVFENLLENNTFVIKTPIDVLLTPPPDLVVHNIQTPTTWSTGETVEIKWMIQNVGNDSPFSQRFWEDSVALDYENINIMFGTSSHYGAMKSKTSYTASRTVYVSPNLRSGDYLIKVTTDYRNGLFEYTNENNNMLITRITINQTLPDLKVIDFSVSVAYENESTMVIANWTVKNVGIGKTLSNSWIDSVQAQMSGQWYDMTQLQIKHENGLRSGESYTKLELFSLPFTIYGNIRFRIVSDTYRTTVGDITSNNVLESSPLLIKLRAADFNIAQNVLMSEDIQGGKFISITYNVTNIGTRKVTNATWYDRIFIADNAYSSISSYGLDISNLLFQNLDQNESYISTVGFTLPKEMSGTYYALIDVNRDEKVFEGLRTGNNRAIKKINVETAPITDLFITSVVAKVNGTVGKDTILYVEWFVKNIGNSMNSLYTWQDRVLFKLESNVQFLDTQPTFSISNNLETQMSYTLSRKIVLPSSVTGNVYVCVEIDTFRTVYEGKTRQNNFRCLENPIYIKKLTSAILVAKIEQIYSLDQTKKFIPGVTVEAKFSVQNVGELVTEISSWTDSLYIANISSLSPTNIKTFGNRVRDILHVGFLYPNETYYVETLFPLPNIVQGEPAVFVIANNTETQTAEKIDHSNTVLEPTSSSVVGIPASFQQIQISNVLPNLVIGSNMSIKSIQSGQPLTIEYKITNTGNVTVDRERIWYDSAYLSDDFIVDAFDIKLISVPRSLQLDSNDSQIVNISFILPLYLQSKTYVLAVVCDSRDDIYEENENDNELQIVFEIEGRSIADIVVSRVVAPSNVQFGSDMKIRWNVLNNGTNNANGYKCDSVYLSKDTKWDINDAQVGQPVCSSFSLKGNGSDAGHYVLQSGTPWVISDTYHTIVKSRSNILDLNLENNVAAAIHETNVEYNILDLNSKIQISFNNTAFIAFRIRNISADETLVVQVSSVIFDNLIKVYIKSGGPATHYDFDRSSETPYANQTVTVPNTESSDYYILVENAGFSQYPINKHPIFLTAKYAQFDILNVYPSSLIYDAETTLHLTGTLIPYDVNVMLTNQNGSYDALSTYVFSSTEMYVTFMVKNDVYNPRFSIVLTSESLNRTITLSDSVSLKSGTLGYLESSVDTQTRLREGTTGIIEVNLQNGGDSDMLVPIIVVSASEEGKLRLIGDKTPQQFKQKYVLFGFSDEGPAGILPPKSYTKLRFETKEANIFTRAVSMQLNVSNIRIDSETPNPYLDLKNVLQPTHYEKSAWEIIWKRFITMTGNSTLSLVQQLSKTLNEMSLAGRYVRNVDDIVQYLLKIADAPFGNGILLRVSDFDIESDMNIPFFLDRYLSSRIGSRTQFGYMGKGWILPLWDTKIKKIDNTFLTLSLEKEDFDFVKLNDTTFLNDRLGYITKKDTDFYHKRPKGNKEYRFNGESLRLSKISSLTDESFLKLTYNNNLLTKIQHSSGTYVEVEYDSNKIQTMLLKNTSDATDIDKLSFTYDDMDFLLEVHQRDKVTKFNYNQDSSVKSMTGSDGSVTTFEYSAIGDVISRRYFRNERLVDSQQYAYSGNGRVFVYQKPENIAYSSTFDENGNIILIQQKGFLPLKTVSTGFEETQYEGDTVITRRIVENNGDTLVVEDGNGDHIRVSFDEKGQLVRLADGGGNEYKYSVNLNGSIRLITFPDGTNKSFTHGPTSLLEKTQSGAVKRIEYDNKRNIIMKDIGNGSITTFNYDHNGEIDTIINENSQVHLTYESGKIKALEYPDRTITYSYNSDEQVSSITTDDGYYVKYEYNNEGNIQYVRDKTGQPILTAKYIDGVKLAMKILGNNATTLYRYDPVTGLLLELSNYFPNGSLASFFRYTYSLSKTRIYIESHEGIWKFKYDRAGQLLFMIDPKGTKTEYKYDNRKNRKSVSVDGVQQNSIINEMNQYMSYKNVRFTYDKNGNMITRNGSTLDIFEFDEENKLVSLKTNGNECNFKYDGLGNLYSKQCNDRTTRYIVNPLGNFGSDVIEKITTKDDLETVEHFYHGGGQIGLIAVLQMNGRMNYFQYDPLGSVQAILDEDGQLLNSYSTDPFGNELASKERFNSTFTFVGQWGVMRIEEMPGIFYMRSRFYDSFTGRFLSLDSYGIQSHSKNFYAYCSNNPVSFNDPEGKCSFCKKSFAIIAKIYVKCVYCKKSIAGLGMYFATTQLKDISWGGATGAIIAGAIGAPFPHRVGGAFGQMIGGLAQHIIDDRTYGLKEFLFDAGPVAFALAFPVPARIWDGIKIGCNAANYLQHINWLAKVAEICNLFIDIPDKLWRGFITWVSSHDPNDIQGPAGFGAACFISKKSALWYLIRFENDANATAPAQRVYIQHQYSEHLDSRTFVMGDFGFGSFTKQVPVGSRSFQGNIDRSEQLGVAIKVFAGIDLMKRMVIWEFQAIDPKTGETPTDPGIGFLPPNNGTSGQGFVKFSMQPNENAQHLSTINANATIFFDQNEPIDTPNIIHTIDDSVPVINVSVIPGTEEADSATLSLQSLDTGSGVKHVDLFKSYGDGYELFKSGITDNVFVVSLKPGDSLSLVAIPVDQVGNRIDIDKVDPSSMLNISSAPFKTNCSCSGNGNCSEDSNVCICSDGYYGSTCNSTSPPPEPPVLELKSESGFKNEAIQMVISARNLSGLLEHLEIVVSGFSPGTNFSNGNITNNQTLILGHTEFGSINMTTDQEGETDLTVQVLQRSADINFTRTEKLSVMVYSHFSAEMNIDGCFTQNDKDEIIILFNYSFASDLSMRNAKNKSFVIPHASQLTVPSWVQPFGAYNEDGMYSFDDYVLNGILGLSGRFEMVNLSVILSINPEGVPESYFKKDMEVVRFCEGECSNFTYGVKCNKSCLCEWQNTESPWCDKFNGSCICSSEWKGEKCDEFACPCIANNTAKCYPSNQTCTCKEEWTGDGCDIDIDECNNTAICDVVPNSFCINHQWGYDCHCLRGYHSENYTCVECTEGNFGMDCSEQCACVSNNTVHCDRFNGSCQCYPQWEGETCHTDIDECQNNTICDVFPHTFCHNRDWGYDCLCMVGYKWENDKCTECRPRTFGMNCKEVCTCQWNNTIQCNRFNGSCECVVQWEGPTCETDVDECINSTICDIYPHTVCQNRDWGYDCLCMVGYDLVNDSCTEEAKPNTTGMMVEDGTTKVTLVVIRIGSFVPANDNLKAAVTFKKYENRTKEMLSGYYKDHIGDGFLEVVIKNLRKGSLVIDHEVVTENFENVTQALTVAVYQLLVHQNSSLLYDGMHVMVEDVTVNNVKVSSTDTPCDVFMSVQHCNQEYQICDTDADNKMVCRNVEKVEKKDYTVLIVSTSCSAVLVVIVVLVVVCICRRKKRSNDYSY